MDEPAGVDDIARSLCVLTWLTWAHTEAMSLPCREDGNAIPKARGAYGFVEPAQDISTTPFDPTRDPPSGPCLEWSWDRLRCVGSGSQAYPGWDRQVSVRDGLEYKNELTNPLFIPPRHEKTENRY